MSTLALADADPSLLPCWRWQAAERICDDTTTKRWTDDDIIQEAAAYLHCDDTSRFPLIHTAREIFEADGLARAELEARILAGQSDTEIGEQCDMLPQLVAVYHDLFFFVRRYLGSTDWVLSRTVGDARWRGFLQDEIRQFWAWAAMGGGPVLVDTLVQSLRDSLRPSDSPTLAVYLRDGDSVSTELQGFMAINVIPAGIGNHWLVEFGNQVLEMKKNPAPDRALHLLRSEMIHCARTYLETGRLPDPPPQNPLRGILLAKRSRALFAEMFGTYQVPQLTRSPISHGRKLACADRQYESTGEDQQSRPSQTDRPTANCDGKGGAPGGHHPGRGLPSEHGGVDPAR